MTPLTLSPATASDVRTMGPVAERLPMRVKAVTARVGDEIVGVGGFGYLQPGTLLAFANLTDDCRKRKIQLHRAALKVLADAEKTGARSIVARADASVPAATRWLERLGFAPVVRNGETIYVREIAR